VQRSSRRSSTPTSASKPLASKGLCCVHPTRLPVHTPTIASLLPAGCAAAASPGPAAAGAARRWAARRQRSRPARHTA
jgi:hypothetical protein